MQLELIHVRQRLPVYVPISLIFSHVVPHSFSYCLVISKLSACPIVCGRYNVVVRFKLPITALKNSKKLLIDRVLLPVKTYSGIPCGTNPLSSKDYRIRLAIVLDVMRALVNFVLQFVMTRTTWLLLSLFGCGFRMSIAENFNWQLAMDSSRAIVTFRIAIWARSRQSFTVK